MTAYLAPAFNQQFLHNGVVAAGYKLYTYDSGTTTPKATYTNQAGTIAHTNPITLDADGRIPGSFWLGDGEYTFSLYTDEISDGGALVKTWSDNGSDAANTVRLDLAAETGAAMVGFKPNYASAIAHTLATTESQWVSIFMWMSDAQIAAYQARTKPDITTAITNALAAFPSGKVQIYFPFGAFKTTAQVTVNQDRVHLVGAGRWATEWDFAPTANATCLKVDKGSTVAYQGSIKGFAWTSSDTTYTKIAVHIVDGSGYEVSDIAIGPSANWTGSTGSIGVRIDGREIGVMCNWYVSADKPLVIGPIPAPHSASGIGIDHHNFHNMYLIANGLVSADFSPITIETGVLLTQVSFTGFQAWIGGKHGLQWIDTTSTAVSNGLTIDNHRCEQTSNAAGYLVYIEHNQELQGLTIRGGQGGDRNGFHLRKVSNVVFDGFHYTGTGEALNVNATVKRIEGRTCFWQAGSTATLTGQQLVFGVPLNPNTAALPPTFFYDETANAVEALSIGGTFAVNNKAIAGVVGATTVNSILGRVFLPAGATSMLIGNNTVATGSIIFLTPGANDATGAGLNVLANNGSFFVYADTAPTADWPINFFVMN